MIQSAGAGDVAALTALLASGAQLEAKDDEHGGTALIHAATYNHVDAINLLLDRGAQLEAKNNNGTTALGQAAFSGAVDAVKLLLDRGAAYVARNDGKIPYDQACAAGVHSVHAKPENKARIQELLRPLHEQHLATKAANKAAEVLSETIPKVTKALA